MRVPDESRAPRIASGRTPAILRDVVTGPRPLDWTTADSGDGSLASTERITIPGIMYCYLSDHIVESILFEYLLSTWISPCGQHPSIVFSPFSFHLLLKIELKHKDRSGRCRLPSQESTRRCQFPRIRFHGSNPAAQSRMLLHRARVVESGRCEV